MTFNNLPINWFDVALGAVLCFGLWRGRRNGMSKEAMLVFQWLTLSWRPGWLFLVCADLCQHAGNRQVTSAILGYCTLALATGWCSTFSRGYSSAAGRQQFFRRWRYYLGMVPA